jgi:hypothetical protein
VTAAVVILALAVAACVVALIVQSRQHATERKALINRVIARHAGEVLALDREVRAPRKTEPRPEHYPTIGLN